MKCRVICTLIEKKFPLEYAEDYDNVGLLIGDENKEVERILISLEITEKVINEAIEKNVDMIISHHPLIFKPLKKITNSGYVENQVIKLIENKINLYALHTNFDAAKDGMNSILCEKLKLENIEELQDNLETSIGKIGYLPNEVDFKTFYNNIKLIFNIKNVIVSGDDNKVIKKVAVVGGSGSGYLNDALKKNCDCLLTGDVKHHTALDYSNMGINIIDLTHYDSEIVFKEEFKNYLKRELDINIVLSEVETNPLKIV